MNLDSSKLQYHPKPVSNWLETGISFPVYVEISPTNLCNHKCIFCGLDNYHNKDFIETESMLDTIKQLSTCGTKTIMFAGEGEPLLHKHLPIWVKTAKNNNISVAITTNGSVKNNYEILKQNCSWIKISFNGGNRETYKNIHGVDMFDKVVENIKKLVATKGNSEISMQFLLLEDNYDSLRDFIILAQGLGVNRAIIKPYSQHLSSCNKREVDYQVFNDTCENLKNLYETDNFKINYRKRSALRKQKEYQVCYSTPNFWAYIDSIGDIYTCSCFIGDKRFNIGNIYKQSFLNAWEKRDKNIMDKVSIEQCRLNCRMEANNEYLYRLKHPKEFDNFI